MFCLFLDTSSSQSVFSLFSDGQVVEEICLDMASSRHPCLIWQGILERQGVTLQQIDFLACGVGPGSYTGMRTAVATVKGVSFATKKPIVALSSLLLLSPTEEGRYVLLVNGGFSGAYMQKVQVSKEQVCFDAPQTTSIEMVTGEVVTDCSAWLGSSENEINIRTMRRHGHIVARVAFEEYRAAHIHTAETISPLYLRKTQAEIEKDSTDQKSR